MNKFLTLTAEQRRAVFERVGVNVGLPMQAVEKDFWVSPSWYWANAPDGTICAPSLLATAAAISSVEGGIAPNPYTFSNLG